MKGSCARRRCRLPHGFGMLLLVALAMYPSAAFGLGLISGAIVPVAAPPSLAFDQLQSNTQIFLIEERLSAVVDAALAVDVNGTPGLYALPADLLPGTIAAGSVIDVHLLHFDPVTLPLRLAGSVTFDKPIVGLSMTRPRLALSDVFGAPGTTYPTLDTETFREFELGAVNPSTDSADISPDRRTLSVDMGVTQYYDEIRVFTAVPEPNTLALGLAGMLSILGMRLGHHGSPRRADGV